MNRIEKQNLGSLAHPIAAISAAACEVVFRAAQVATATKWAAAAVVVLPAVVDNSTSPTFVPPCVSSNISAQHD